MNWHNASFYSPNFILILHSFPTRRSSDLQLVRVADVRQDDVDFLGLLPRGLIGHGRAKKVDIDRKSTRLNSSHANISYAVFCLKKKKCYNVLPQLDINNTIYHRPEGE